MYNELDIFHMVSPDLSIIIVSFNTRGILKKCLESLSNGLLGFDKESEVILVDNHSTDGSVELFKNSRKRLLNDKLSFQLILNRENLGFAKAINQGIRKSRGKYILLLNSDIICQPESITKLIHFSQQNNNLGLVGGRLLNPDGSGQASVFHLPNIKRAVSEFWLGKISNYQKYLPQVQDASEVEAVSGAVMLIPRGTISRVGLLNEAYFMYFEDLDYCRRLRKEGLKVFYCPQAEFIHFHGQSGKENPGVVSSFLVKSSKIYFGILGHYLINLIIWTGQKWRFLNAKK